MLMLRKLLYIIIFLGIAQLWGQDQKVALDYFRKGDYEKAANLYEKLLEENQHNSYYFKYLLKCQQALENYGKVDTLINNRIKKHPRQTHLWVELGYNYTLQHREIEAKKYFDKAFEILQEKPSAGYLIAKSFQENHLLDYALNAYQFMMEKLPAANYNYQLAAIYGEKGDITKMFDTYLDMVAQQGGTLYNVQRFIGKFLTDDPQDENNKLFRKLLIKKLQENPKNEWNKLLSWLYLQQKDYFKALLQEKAVFKRSMSDLDGIINVGAIAFDAGDYKTAQDAFTYCIKNTNDTELQIYATYYLLESKRVLETDIKNIETAYSKAFETFGKGNSTTRLQISYANFLTFTADQPQKAISVLNKALENRLDKFQKAEIQIQLGDVLVYTGNYNRALIIYSQVQLALKSHALAQLARYKVAQTSYFKGDFEWANIQLKVLKRGTANLIANDALDLSLLIDDNTAQDSIPTALKKYAVADLLAYQNKKQQAIDSLSVLLKNFKGHSIEDEAYYKRGQLYEKLGNYKAATQDYIQITELKDNDILIDDALYKIAELYDLKLNQPDKAKDYYKKIVFEYPSSIYLVPARKRFRQLRGDVLVP